MRAELEPYFDELLAAYLRAGERIEDELRAIGELEAHASRRARLRALQREIQGLTAELDTRARGWLTDELPTVYSLGGQAAATSLGTEFTWTVTHTAAVNEIARDTLSSMLDATEHMRSDVKALVRASTKEAALNKLLVGQTATQAGRELSGELARRSVNAVVYKNGARHGIADYADMVMRTTTATAYNVGNLTEGRQAGYKYAVCLDGVGCGLTGHRTGPAANGLVLPIEQALMYPISHPRCQRTWSSVPARTREDAKRMGDSSEFAPSRQQQRDQARVETQRAERQNRHRARLAARERRLAKRQERLTRS